MLVLLIVCLTCSQVFGNLITESNNRFAVDIYRNLAGHKDNFVFSPFSAQALVVFIEAGTGGTTSRQIRNKLHLPDRQTCHEHFKTLMNKLRTKVLDVRIGEEDDSRIVFEEYRESRSQFKEKKPYSFYIATKAYVQNGYSVKDEFKNVAEEVFDAPVEHVDFSRKERTARQINNWIEEATNNKIHDLITPDKLDSSTRIVFVNALYLKGTWKVPFRKMLTQEKPFFVNHRTVVPVSMMRMQDDEKTFFYSENLEAQFLELPLKADDDVAVVFVLPFSKSGIRKLERRLPEVLMPQAYTREHVNMSIPKFKIESQIDFRQYLINLGVKQVFEYGRADLSGIGDNLEAVSEVVQKSFIAVDELGVEAAAATYTRVVTLGIQATPQYKQFNADHPFIYYIRVNDLIVFVGKVTEPIY